MSGRAATAGRDPVEAFVDDLSFEPDDFQREAIEALAAGRSVLVAAPTGAGKTLVGEYACWQALADGGRCFYTTPIKALSNQKLHELRALHGHDEVGLLTGDHSINGDAPIVVMTTEVLRNMLYEASDALDRLHAVVLDEVHYLADRARGAVWEEVIIQLPQRVQLASLSATVSNAEEVGDWLSQVRHGCEVIISEHRPVPLEHHYAVGDRVLPMFTAPSGKAGRKGEQAEVERARQAKGGRPNPEILMLERRQRQRGRPDRRGRRHAGGPRMRRPRRWQVVDALDRRDWLPAIYFLFSRAGCDDAVEQVLSAGVSLTDADERRRIDEVVDHRLAHLADDEVRALDADRWAAALGQGVAAHHAGKVPLFKEVVEELFTAGLVKVCFATETLALGINMPARSVVIERLEKWDGQQHRMLTPGQLTQLTGRAGRRGLDERGHAVVLHQPELEFRTIAGLVGRRVEPLVSSFAPSYNMAVNLLRRHDRAAAEELLGRSLAQFQADRAAGDHRDRLRRSEEALAGYDEQVSSVHGDVDDYLRLRDELRSAEQERGRRRAERVAVRVREVLGDLAAGDVVAVPHPDGPGAQLAAVVDVFTSADGSPVARVIDERRRSRTIGPRELDRPPAVVGSVDLPHASLTKAKHRRAVVDELTRVGAAPRLEHPERTAGDDPPELAERVAVLRRRLRDHPVSADPRVGEIETWADRRADLAAETRRLRRGLERRTGSLARQLDRILAVLADLGYVTERRDPRPTDDGLRLARVYTPADLVLTEVLRRGVLDPLGPADLAAVASLFTHNPRGRVDVLPSPPSPAAAGAIDACHAVHAEVAAMEQAHRLEPTEPLEEGFTASAHAWAQGADLDRVVEEAQLTAGDLVREVRQVVDLLGQLRDAAGPPVRGTAAVAVERMLRGVVAQEP